MLQRGRAQLSAESALLLLALSQVRNRAIATGGTVLDAGIFMISDDLFLFV
jgi:hypothetical protein